MEQWKPIHENKNRFLKWAIEKYLNYNEKDLILNRI